MRVPLILPIVSLAALAVAVHADHPSAQIESTEIIVLDPAALNLNDTVRRDQVRFTPHEPTEVVGEFDEGGTNWFGSDRERLGGEDAPRRILVRAFDAVFAIDPFIPLPVGNETAARVLFNGASLETDRALFNRIRIERTRELLHILEGARHRWLRDNGFYGVRVFRSDDAGNGSARAPEPAGWFRVPADVPRGRSIEQVDSGPAPGVDRAAAIVRSDPSVRVSLPFGTAHDVQRRFEARQRGGSVASND